MYCVIQQVQLKKPNQYGAYRELMVERDGWTINGKPPLWRYRQTGERFERPHLEAYLKQIQRDHKTRQDARRRQQQFYREQGSYSAAPSSNYTDDETAMLKQFYKVLSKKYHPDLNPGRDTTAEMQLLNRLKQIWGI